MSAHFLFVSLIVAVVSTATASAGTGLSERLLIGRWVSARETLTFFANREFTFSEEHGPSVWWQLRGRHLTFGIPKRGVNRRADLGQLTPRRLVLLESGKKKVYARLDHY
ncbi:MAG: hypothetical protein WAO00_04375 [Chthoniobacterales bacterium]